MPERFPVSDETREPSDAEQRIELARRALIDSGYFTEGEVGQDIAPRIIELIGILTADDEEERAEPMTYDDVVTSVKGDVGVLTGPPIVGTDDTINSGPARVRG